MVYLLSSARDSLLPVTSGGATLYHALSFPFFPLPPAAREQRARKSRLHIRKRRNNPNAGGWSQARSSRAQAHRGSRDFFSLSLPALQGTEIETELVKVTNVIHCGTERRQRLPDLPPKMQVAS